MFEGSGDVMCYGSDDDVLWQGVCRDYALNTSSTDDTH